MVIDERSRHAMFTRLQEVLGEEQATVLMEHLPPVGWADVATKHDIDALRVGTKHDIDALRVATKHDLDALRVATKHDIDALRAVTKHDLDALRVSTKRDLEHAVASLEQRSEILENRLLATFRAELNVQTRTMIYAMSASTVTVATLAFGAARLV